MHKCKCKCKWEMLIFIWTKCDEIVFRLNQWDVYNMIADNIKI